MKLDRLLLLCLLLLTLPNCQSGEKKNPPRSNLPPDNPTPHEEEQSSHEEEQSSPSLVSPLQLRVFGWHIPPQQEKGDLIPPQFGKRFTTTNGASYVCGYDNPAKKDLFWTAFTLVLWRADGDGKDKIEILTQARKHSKVIEAPGGHLHDGASWREGAAQELMEEAGITVPSAKLLYLQGGDLKERASKKSYSGNVNFFVVFAKAKPNTTLSHENDPAYGHQWLNLHTVYEEAKAEQAIAWNKNGKYYRFFRGHVIEFGKKVLGWN